MNAQNVHLSIARNWRDVYDFAHKPENMPLWASGLANGLEPDGEDWIADGGPIGKVRVRFAPENAFGVMDHRVTLPNGVSVDNALRVAPNGDGAEVIFTLLQGADMDDAQFAADAAHVRKDLETLKAIMESRSA
jgi:hypothetical protein